MRVCVVGLGKIGLPLAACFAENGIEVIGADISKQVVDSVNKGISHVKEEPGLEERVRKAHERGLLKATADTTGAVKQCEVAVIVVPLVVNGRKEPDFSALDAATKAVARGLGKGKLVVYETTMPIGTTAGRMKHLLEQQSGLVAGKDFMLAYSPERVNSNTIFRDLAEYPKIVGGIDRASAEKAVEFYRKVLRAEVIDAGSCETAEMVKLCGMTYRDANIAVANSFARIADAYGIDVIKAIELANTIPHTKILRPGIGVGGHCAPVYPHFMIANAKAKGIGLPVIEAARRENDGMAEYSLARLGKAIGGLKGKKVLLLGIAYRENVKETAFATSLLLIKGLKKAGADVFAVDPLFETPEIEKFGAKPAMLDSLPAIDAAILVSYHDQFRGMKAKRLADAGAKVLLDGRNALGKAEVEAAGMKYIGIGRE